MYLKGKHTFSILQAIIIQALVCKCYCRCPMLTQRARVQGVYTFSFSINSLSGDFMFQNIKLTAAKSIFHLVFTYKGDHHKETPNFSDVILAHVCYRGLLTHGGKKKKNDAIFMIICHLVLSRTKVPVVINAI